MHHLPSTLRTACRPTHAARRGGVAWVVTVLTTWVSFAAAQGGLPAPACPEDTIPRPVIDAETLSPSAYFHVPSDVDIRIRLTPLERLDVDISSIISGEAIAPDGEVVTGVARLDPRQREFDEVTWHPDAPLAPGDYEFVLRVAVSELPDCQLEPAETTSMPMTVLAETIEEVIDSFELAVSASQRQLPVDPDCCPIDGCAAGPCTQCWQVYTQVQHVFDWFEVPGGYYLNVTLTPDLPSADPVSARGTRSAVVYSPTPSFCVEARVEAANSDEGARTLDACSVDPLPEELSPPGALESVSPESCMTWPSSVLPSARTLWVARGEDEAEALAALGVVVGGAPGSGGGPGSGGETAASGGTGGATEARSGCVAVPTPTGPARTWTVFLLLAMLGAGRRRASSRRPGAHAS